MNRSEKSSQGDRDNLLGWTMGEGQPPYIWLSLSSTVIFISSIEGMPRGELKKIAIGGIPPNIKNIELTKLEKMSKYLVLKRQKKFRRAFGAAKIPYIPTLFLFIAL